MTLSKGDQAALKAAQDIITRGQARGDDAAVAEGNRVQNNILADNGVVVGNGTKPDLTLGGTVAAPSGNGSSGGGGSYAAAAGKLSGNSEGAVLVGELKNLYGANGPYAAALAAQQKANQANVDKAVSTLEGQKQNTTQSYAEMFQQLYRQKKNAQKNIGQQMAAQGVTGGASESTLLGLETNYAEALRQGHQGRADALGELDRAIAAARLDGDITNAQLAADSAKERVAGYAGVLQSLIARDDNQRAQQLSYERQDQQIKNANDREDAANKLSYARQLALAIAQSGNMPTDELLASAGLSRADVESIVSSAVTEETESADTTTWKPLLTASQTLSALNDGIINDSTLAAYEYWYGQPWQQTSDVVVDPAKPPAGKGYDNEGLKPAQVREMQAYYGLTTDGMWGPNSQSTTKMGAQAAWKAYQAALNGGGPRLVASTVGTPETYKPVYTASGKQVDSAVVEYFNELLEGGVTQDALLEIVERWVSEGYRGVTQEDVDQLLYEAGI